MSSPNYHFTVSGNQILGKADTTTQVTNKEDDGVEVSLPTRVPNVPKPGPYQCTICQASFPDRTSALQHIRSHSRPAIPAPRTFVCEFCHQTYGQRSLLKQHKAEEHSDELAVAPVLATVITSTSTSNIVLHPPSVKLTLPNSSGLDSPTRKGAISLAKCTLCGRTFARTNELTLHQAVHRLPVAYACDSCGALYARDSDRRKHQRSVHGLEELGVFRGVELNDNNVNQGTAKRPHACPKCNYRAASKLRLVNHLRIHRTQAEAESEPAVDQPPLPQSSRVCRLCPRFLKGASALRDHMSLHSLPNVPRCTLCGAVYDKERSLISHLYSMHQVVGEVNCKRQKREKIEIEEVEFQEEEEVDEGEIVFCKTARR